MKFEPIKMVVAAHEVAAWRFGGEKPQPLTVDVRLESALTAAMPSILPACKFTLRFRPDLAPPVGSVVMLTMDANDWSTVSPVMLSDADFIAEGIRRYGEAFPDLLPRERVVLPVAPSC